MKTNSARHKLKRGEPAIGTWLTFSDFVSARLMSRMGFDWLTVELEHSPTSFESAAAQFAIIRDHRRCGLRAARAHPVEHR
jgi:4-hydroxy-2-oxoheptanedioate aldolase